jgi:uncharacterized integral membrane protein (TIGR00697 family)
MATIVVASNITYCSGPDGLLTWGAAYPLAFLVTDVMNRVYGPSAARKVVFTGLIVRSSVVDRIADRLAGDGFTLSAVALRIAIASATAFLIAQLLDIAVFNRLREDRGGYPLVALW